MLIFVDFEDVGLLISLLSLFSLLFLNVAPLGIITYSPSRFLIYYHVNYNRTFPIPVTSYYFFEGIDFSSALNVFCILRVVDS